MENSLYVCAPQPCVHWPRSEQSGRGHFVSGRAKTWPETITKAATRASDTRQGHSESTKPPERRDIHAPQVACKFLADHATKSA